MAENCLLKNEKPVGKNPPSSKTRRVDESPEKKNQAGKATEVASSLTLRVGVRPQRLAEMGLANTAAVQRSDIYNSRLNLDLHQRNDLAAVRTGTNSGDRFPSLSAFEVRVPKRPSPTLSGSHRVDRALSSGSVEEGAVTVCELTQRDSSPHKLRVVDAELANADASMIGDLLHLFVADPDVTRFASAAIATLSTRKGKAVLVPRLFTHRLAPL